MQIAKFSREIRLFQSRWFENLAFWLHVDGKWILDPLQMTLTYFIMYHLGYSLKILTQFLVRGLILISAEEWCDYRRNLAFRQLRQPLSNWTSIVDVELHCNYVHYGFLD